ncbi:mannonate dehydratase [Pedobacter sp. UYP30]|uniref:mannonate dehydratase n=1 Tax=Pedobacter sp. UYP30 TaxID=1756400 RepID=UPI0033932115
MTEIKKLEQTFRWFGPNDEVTLADIRQTGATGVVTALHHIPCGHVWSIEEVAKRKDEIENAGLTWSVIESINIHESIKIGSADRDEWIEKYIQSLKHVSEMGLSIVCYNFMPVLDWTRTNLDFILPNRASALKYDAVALAAFDLFILEREGAEKDFSTERIVDAKAYFDGLSKEEKETLQNTIMAGLPGTDEVFTPEEFKRHLKKYEQVDASVLRENLAYFLRAIVPDAEKMGIKMCIHPDDPPFPILGLPRVVCNADDLEYIVSSAPSPANGITFCTGSLGANPANNLPEMLKRFGPHIHFLHLRNVTKEANGSFYEADHLNGDNDMANIMEAVIREQQSRQEQGRDDVAIPVRPDHGHKILADVNQHAYPGYSVTGRMKGLAELRGLELGLRKGLLG